jgi:hypothetical protein
MKTIPGDDCNDFYGTMNCTNSTDTSLRDTVEPLIKNLARLVWEDNVNAQKTFDELKNAAGNSFFANEMNLIADSIGDFDFDAAKEPLRKIASELNIEI